MKIEHYEIDQTLKNSKILELLLKNELYSPSGCFKYLYTNPQKYIKSKAHISVMFVASKPVSVVICLKDEFYGWDKHVEGLRATYGNIGFFTVPKHRKKGYAAKLFDAFRKEFNINEPVAACYKATNLMKVIPDSHKIIF